MSRDPAGSSSPLDARATRRALEGFSLSGLLAALLGVILPAWGYHHKFEFVTIGNYFLSVVAGVVLSVETARRLLPRHGVRFLLILACALACGALLLLAYGSPPAAPPWRMSGLVLVGLAMGLLNRAVFQVISAAYLHDPAATLNLAGAIFGMGSLLVTLLVAGLFDSWPVTGMLIVIAAVPALFTALYARTAFPPAAVPSTPSLRQAMQDVKRPAAILLSLLLFFQFGNEWSIAGWLALFLIHRLGMSPRFALSMLAIYWIALLLGRVGTLALLSRAPHGRLLAVSAAGAMFGCIILLSTDNSFGAGAGVLLAGLGFAAIYPLVAEKIGRRFGYYHPGLFNGVFSFAMVGAMLAPSTCGYLAAAWGVGVVMALPLAGTMIVFVLILAIRLDTKVGG